MEERERENEFRERKEEIHGIKHLLEVKKEEICWRNEEIPLALGGFDDGEWNPRGEKERDSNLEGKERVFCLYFFQQQHDLID